MTDNIEYREVELELRKDDERVVTGIAIPWNEVAIAKDYNNGQRIIRERVERDAVVNLDKDIYLYANHDHINDGFPVGRISKLEIRDDGLYFEATFDNNDKADVAYLAAHARQFRGLSAGFEPISQREENGVIVREKIKLREISLVPRGAYKTAGLLEVRSDSQGKEDNVNTMENEVNETVADLDAKVTDLERRMAVNEEKGGRAQTEVKPRFDSVAQLLYGYGHKDNDAQLELRAFTDTAVVLGESVTNPQWANETLKLVEENRTLFNRFRKGAPLTSDSVKYPKVNTTSGAVGVQANEGDNLNYLQVTVTSGTADVDTYGGYSRLSRQTLELSSVDHLEVSLRYQAFQYAKATESAVRTALAGATGTSTASLVPALDTTTDADTAVLWTRLVRNAGRQMRLAPGNPAPQFMVVSSDVMDRIADLADSTGRPLFGVRPDTVNSLGTQNILGADAVIGTLPVFEDVNLAANSCYIANAEAITTYESAGAPVRLAAEDIINLSKDFSLYGYLAVGVTNPKSIVKCDVEFNEA